MTKKNVLKLQTSGLTRGNQKIPRLLIHKNVVVRNISKKCELENLSVMLMKVITSLSVILPFLTKNSHFQNPQNLVQLRKEVQFRNKIENTFRIDSCYIK